MTRHFRTKHSATTRILTATAVLTLSASLGAQSDFTSWPAHQAPAQYQQLIARGDLIVAAMDDALVREVEDAVSKRGTEGALASCHLDATFMAQRLARYEGVAAGRTSDRLRNPTNAPPKWAAALVRGHAGERARDVDGFAVDLGDRVGLLRPIAQRRVCNGCHGRADATSAGVKTALADRYPSDRALGFTEGEIRGWFWVELRKPTR